MATEVPHAFDSEYEIIDVPVETMPITPPLVIVTTPVLELLHVPPVEVSLKVTTEERHSDVKPVIAPIVGSGFTVIVYITFAIPHVFVFEKVITALPPLIPVTMPLPDTPAVLELQLHAPPDVVSVNVIVDPSQTVEGPEITEIIGKPPIQLSMK